MLSKASAATSCSYSTVSAMVFLSNTWIFGSCLWNRNWQIPFARPNLTCIQTWLPIPRQSASCLHTPIFNELEEVKATVLNIGSVLSWWSGCSPILCNWNFFFLSLHSMQLILMDSANSFSSIIHFNDPLESCFLSSFHVHFSKWMAAHSKHRSMAVIWRTSTRCILFERSNQRG